MDNTNDERVKAIRDDKLVGRGSCTSIDECYDDADLVKELDAAGITTPEDALKWAKEGEGLFLEQGLNQRWGDDDDPQLKAWNEWKEKLGDDTNSGD